MIIKSKNIFIEGGFNEASVVFEDGLISSISKGQGSLNQEVIDYGDYCIIPGLLDIHFHGCNGHDFCEGSTDALDAISEYQLQNGITSICPATMTYPEETLTPAVKCASTYKNSNGAEIVGINMEGPFISKEKLGAQNPEYVQKPNVEFIHRLNNVSNNLIKLIDIAPETYGALDFINELKDDFTISIAHTNADYNTAANAYRLGAKHLTHTFNAMPPLLHRKPGPIAAAVDYDASAEIICDGLHIDFATIRMAFKLFSDSKICLISDSCEATGLDDGQYSLGGQKILKTGNKVVLQEAPDTIAASATNLFDCLKHAIFDAKIPIEKAINAATINPANAIGVSEKIGSIETGKQADLIVLDKSFNIINIYKKGNKVR